MITSERPNVSENGRYTISETCKLLGICRDSLRKYTNEGLIRCGFRQCYNHKFYLGRDILIFWDNQQEVFV